MCVHSRDVLSLEPLFAHALSNFGKVIIVGDFNCDIADDSHQATNFLGATL